MIQLDFFGNEAELLIKNKVINLESDVSKIGESSDRVRKGIFARHGLLSKKMNELEERLAVIERNICKI